MPSSSLIFVLVVAIWAAYLLQHWIRRRDHLSTARSVDRFSEAMRVLERRKPLPGSPLDAPKPRSYAVSPARPQRAEVTVKRAAPQPAVARPGSEPAAKVRVAGRLAKLLSGMTMRRLRGFSLAFVVVLVAATIALAALGRVVWWTVPIAVALLVLDLLWLRHAGAARRRRARKEHAARTAHRVRERRVAQAAKRRVDAGRGSAAPVAAQADRHVDTVYDPDVAVVADRPAAPGSAADTAPAARDPHGWEPRPVPPPTYTLKAKAERPVAPPAAVTPSPEPFDRAAAEDAASATQPAAEATPAAGAGRAGGDEAPYGQDLPFDGLALDEELEELPAAYAAG